MSSEGSSGFSLNNNVSTSKCIFSQVTERKRQGRYSQTGGYVVTDHSCLFPCFLFHVSQHHYFLELPDRNKHKVSNISGKELLTLQWLDSQGPFTVLASRWDLNWDCFVKLLLSRSRNNFHASPISEHESNKRTTATELSCQPIHLHDNWENTSSKDCMMWLKARTDVAYNSATVLESNHGVLYCCSGTSALVAQMYFCFFEHRSSNLTTSINPDIYTIPTGNAPPAEAVVLCSRSAVLDLNSFCQIQGNLFPVVWKGAVAPIQSVQLGCCMFGDALHV